VIVKAGNKYLVKDSKGVKTLGTHSTKEGALAQLRAIEANKKKRISKKMWESFK
jgi:hypothetical protein